MSTLDNPILEGGNTKPGPIALRYGLIGGLIMVGLGLITQLAGIVDMTNPQSTTNSLVRYLNYAIMIVIIVMAVKTFLADNGGLATFGSAFKVGLLTTLVVSAITLVWVLLYFGVIDPTMIDTILEVSKEQMMDQQGMSEEDAEQALGFMGFMFNPVGMAITAALSLTVMGTIFSLVIAAIMKKNPPETM